MAGGVNAGADCCARWGKSKYTERGVVIINAAWQIRHVDLKHSMSRTGLSRQSPKRLSSIQAEFTGRAPRTDEVESSRVNFQLRRKDIVYECGKRTHIKRVVPDADNWPRIRAQRV